MSDRVYVVPAAGRRVRNPETGAVLDQGGAFVVRNQFWERRVRDGDVAITAPPKAAAAPASEKPRAK